MFGCENMSSSQSRSSNNAGSTPLSNILKNTTVLPRRNIHLWPDNPFLQVDSRCVFFSEDFSTRLPVHTCTDFTSEDLCSGRKRGREKNEDNENSPSQANRNNQAAKVNKNNLDSQCKGSYQTPFNAKNSVISGSYTDSHSVSSSTGVFPSCGSTPLHLSSYDPFLKVHSCPPPGTVYTSDHLHTGRGKDKEKENSPSQSIRHNQATINGRSLTQKPYKPRLNRLISMHINQSPTRIPLSDISNTDVSSGFLRKRGKLKKNNFLEEITRTLFEETEVSHGKDRDDDNLDQSWIANFDSNDKTTSSAGTGIGVAVKPEYCITPSGSTTDPVMHKYIVPGLSREVMPLAVAKFGDDSAKMGFSSNNVAEALLGDNNNITDKAVAHSSMVRSV